MCRLNKNYLFLIINDKKVKEESVKENEIKFNDKGSEAEAVLNRHFTARQKKNFVLLNY